MTTLGADPEALERLATLIDRTVVRIGQSGRDVSRQLTTAGWRGVDADRLRLEWRTQGSGALGRMQTVLQECATILRSQAAAQRGASAAHGSPAADAAYAKVDRNSQSTTFAAEALVPLKFFNVKGEVAGTITTSQDGLGTVVTLSGAGGAGLTSGLKGAGAASKGGKKTFGAELGSLAEAETTRSYRFDSLAEATDLKEKYVKAVIPSMADAELETLFRGGVAGDAWLDGEEVLASVEDKKVSDVLKLSKTDFAKIDFGYGLLDLHAGMESGVGVEIDQMNKEATFFVSAGVDVGAALGLEVGAEAAVEAGLTVDFDGKPQELTLSGSFDLHGGLDGAFGLDPSSLQLGAASPVTAVESGLTTSFDARLDLSDPDTRRHAYAYLQATKTGHGSAATGHLAELLDRTEVIVKTEDVVTTGRSFDVPVGSVSEETSKSTTRQVFIRMPQETWQRYRPAR